MIKLQLPWFDPILNPNKRVHWAPEAKAKRKARMDTAWLTRTAGGALLNCEQVHVSMTFVPPDRRARDLDNMAAATKAHRDGIADVIGIDDSRWSLSFRKVEPSPPGSVLVEISPR
ncbi:endonuclease [Pseudohoeflea coraliihabitans]|uniref:Endonuclease n=1 Tax=Pseudohoeflea coraliihabitans TaxID=2860393 RepID=A0ABS6WIQ0_9HYPH|nr:endonuclease [Pseudohoeflea sp. DP4N28-3]MBW3095660.1 endonuclease [Pseudohoeflea sp. DP4N28-3]